jgi:hypothetical protein
MFPRIALIAGLAALCGSMAHAQDNGKVYSWVDQRSGDCHLSGTLTIYPDGRARWDAYHLDRFNP